MENEIKPILKKKKEIGDYLKLSWIFEKPLEKTILVIILFLALWKVVGFFY